MTSETTIAVHDAGPRRATYYPVTPPPLDPELLRLDVTISWPVILVTLLLVPPLGALQLSHRSDVPIGLRGRHRLGVARRGRDGLGGRSPGAPGARADPDDQGLDNPLTGRTVPR